MLGAVVHEAKGLDIEGPDALVLPWSMIRSLIPWSLMLGERSCAIICLLGYFFLDFRFLGFEEGALGSNMPT
jgi:hypothetical protein